MKKSTIENKLNELFGLTEKAEVVKTKVTGRVVGVAEEDIQAFREAQGIIYFLQAPKLFTARKCTHCGDPFLVSRKYVSCCSYRCIQLSLAEQGIQWKKVRDLEELALDPQVYQGNEPIWITTVTLPHLKEALSTLLNLLESEELTLKSSPRPKFDPENITSMQIESGTNQQSSSSSASTTTSQAPRTKRNSKKSVKKVSFS